MKEMHVFVRTIVFFMTLTLTATNVSGQHETTGQPPTIMPPSPNAFAITRYGGIHVGLQTGTPQIDIPLFKISAKNLDLPVSLFYTSNGVKVDEIASRTGMSWVLHAGGVITRMVVDDPDESGTPATTPNFAVQDRALLNWLDAASLGNGDRNDLSPDFFNFNFNGYSGKFIIKGNKVIPIEKTSLKFETIFGSGLSLGYAFKITDPAGISYYFGEGNSTESSQTSSFGTDGCGRNYGTPVNTSWYLSRIVHPNGDAITFNYQQLTLYSYATGVSQTLTKLTNSTQIPCTSGARCEYIPDGDCKSLATVNAVYLTDIVSSDGEKVIFTYTSRTDLPGDVLLDKMSLYYPGDAVNAVKTAQLTYVYATATGYTNSYTDAILKLRPFLIAMTIQDKNKTNIQRHSFQYNDMNALPPRLSFSQDHFGYFNGASNINLLPTPTVASQKTLFPMAYANREPEFSYGSKGMLTKVIYPTGGYDTIIYAAPTRYVTEPAPSIATVLSATAQGNSSGVPVTNISEVMTATNLVEGNARLGVEFIYGGNPDELDFHNHANVYFTDITTNKVVFSTDMNSDNPSQVLNVSLELNHQYSVKVVAYGNYTIGNIVLTYYRSAGMVSYNKPTGGIVIDKVKTYDPTSNKFNTKRYYYAALSDLTKSTGRMTFNPKYDSYSSVKVNCPGTICHYGSCDYTILTSYSLLNLYAFSQAHICFQKVVEAIGENFEGGGVEHVYETAADQPGEIVMGQDILTSLFSNNGYMNGKETQSLSISKNSATGVFLPVKLTTTEYVEDSRLSELYYGYTVRKVYEVGCQSTIPSTYEIGAYDVKRHYIFSRWIYPSSVTTTTYDVNGQNPFTTTISYGYNNIQHLLPTTVSQTNSKQEVMKMVYQYPQDVNTSQLDATTTEGITALINKHIQPAIITEQYRGSILTNRLVQNYKVWDNGLVAMQNIQTQEGTFPLETRVEFKKYGTTGNILEQSKVNAASQVTLWGYNNRYPVAIVTGSDYATVAALVNLTVLQAPASEAVLKAELSKLRNGLKGKAQVITATYIPSIGITSKIDVAGIEEFYEYDSFQRLRLIRDRNNNIIKQFCYNYAGMPLGCPDAGF